MTLVTLLTPVTAMLAGAAGRRRPTGERGSIAPLILLCFLLAALVVMGTAATSVAFLAQRDLQGECDGAALAGAGALDPVGAYGEAGVALDAVPTSTAVAARAVAEQLAAAAPGPRGAPQAVTESDGRSVTVTCRRVVALPFGALFGHPAGLSRTAVATARAPVRQ